MLGWSTKAPTLAGDTDSDPEPGSVPSEHHRGRGSFALSSSSGTSDEGDTNRCLSCSRWQSTVDRAQMAAEGKRALRASQHGGPRPQRLPDGTCVTAKHWGIRQDQIEELFDACQMEEDWHDEATVHDFVKMYVKPWTQGTEMGYALMINQSEPLQVTVMISHAWVENAKDFFEDVLKYTWEREVAFICFLSNFQGSAEQINAQLGNDILKSPFTEVIRSRACQRMLVVPNEALRENGQGLYSRLWCIWEIKVAADAGLPIIIVPRKSAEEYLLGTTSASSRSARCGDPNLPLNKDERLIRAAIDNLPPQSARSGAVCFFAVCFCVSYGACIGGSLMRNYSGLLIGVGVGLSLGMFTMACIAKGVRRCVWKLRSRDGYHILDKVIRGSAIGVYAWRRITVERDVVPLTITCCIFAAIFMAWRYAQTHNPMHIPVAATEGMGVALLLYFIFQVNLLGMLHGNFFIRRWAQLAASMLLLSSTAAGSTVGFMSSHLCDGMIGLGANLGFLCGVLALSLCTCRWIHVAANLLMISIMLMARYLSPILWREYFLLLCGSISLLTLPDWRHFQRIVVLFICILALLGLELIYVFFDTGFGFDALFCLANSVGTTVFSADRLDRLESGAEAALDMLGKGYRRSCKGSPSLHILFGFRSAFFHPVLPWPTLSYPVLRVPALVLHSSFSTCASPPSLQQDVQESPSQREEFLRGYETQMPRPLWNSDATPYWPDAEPSFLCTGRARRI